jgi:hypothetical protein
MRWLTLPQNSSKTQRSETLSQANVRWRLNWGTVLCQNPAGAGVYALVGMAIGPIAGPSGNRLTSPARCPRCSGRVTQAEAASSLSIFIRCSFQRPYRS